MSDIFTVDSELTGCGVVGIKSGMEKINVLDMIKIQSSYHYAPVSHSLANMLYTQIFIYVLQNATILAFLSLHTDVAYKILLFAIITTNNHFTALAQVLIVTS